MLPASVEQHEHHTENLGELGCPGGISTSCPMCDTRTLKLYNISNVWINVREYQRWTIQRSWQHMVLVYHMLPASLDCLSSSCVPYVASFSGLFVFLLCTICCQFLWIVFLPLVYQKIPVDIVILSCLFQPLFLTVFWHYFLTINFYNFLMPTLHW
jgi:hypothetical protein